MSFSFPPPPPPPPQSSSTTPTQNAANDSNRGRGARGSFRSRGRGSFRGGSIRGQHNRGGQYASHTRDSYSLNQSSQWQPQQVPIQSSTFQSNSYGVQINVGNPFQGQQTLQAHYNPTFSSTFPPAQHHNHDVAIFNAQSTAAYAQPAPMLMGAFGSYGTPHPQFPPQPLASQRNKNQSSNAFGKKRRSDHRKVIPSIPEVAPAVPSFGPSLPSKPDQIPTSHDESQKPPKKKPRKYNQFGLTPRKEEHENSEDDVDDEAKHAHLGTELKFEYKGHTSHLSSPTEIAAWIAERRKRWPTKARIEQKKREAHERREQQAASSKRLGAEDLKSEGHHPKVSTTPELTSTMAMAQITEGPKIHRPANEFPSNLSSSGDMNASHASDTSSAVSDSEPDQEPIKQQTASFKRTLLATSAKPAEVCRFFLRNGRCKYGKDCTHKHERPQPQREKNKVQKPVTSVKKGRMTLHQRLEKQENEEILDMSVGAIEYLARCNFFEED